MIEYFKRHVVRIFREGKPTPCIFYPHVLFDPIEEHLVATKRYVVGQPAPKHPLEEQGFRRIELPIEADYLNFPVRIGTTTLHIRNNSGQNLDSLVLISEDSDAISSVCLLDDRVIAVAYHIRKHPFTPPLCWNPGDEKLFGTEAYPESDLDVRSYLYGLLDQVGLPQEARYRLPETKSLSAIPPLVMLCVNTSEEVYAEQKNRLN